MIRLLGVAALLASTTALATGERVALQPSDSPLRESVCVSMNCEGGRPEATVSTRTVRDGMEVTVTMAGGQRRLLHLVRSRPDGTLSSTELVRATSLVLRAIEEGPVQGDQPVVQKLGKHQKVAKHQKKKARAKLLAHR